MKLRFPEDYPFEPPSLKFLTKIYHPNVVPAEGIVCPTLLTENWAPHLNIRYIIQCLSNMLSLPNGKDVMDEAIGVQYNTNREEFNAHAARWTRKYATNM